MRAPDEWVEHRPPAGRIRLNEHEANTVYPVLMAAEKKALARYVRARDIAAEADPENVDNEHLEGLKQRARRLESVRRKVLELFRQMEWDEP